MTPRVRPSFSLPLHSGPGAFFTALDEELERTETRCRGRLFGDYAIVRIRTEEREIWSPALYLHVDESDEGNPELRGQFSPSSPVWTAFVAIYLTLACLFIASACYGITQLTLDETPWALIGVPLTLLFAGLTYGATFIGQGLGAEDMYELRSFVEGVVQRQEPS